MLNQSSDPESSRLPSFSDYHGRTIKYHLESVEQALSTIRDPTKTLIIRNPSGKYLTWAILRSILEQWKINLSEPFAVYINIMPHGESWDISTYWLSEDGRWEKRNTSHFKIHSVFIHEDTIRDVSELLQ